MQRRGKLGFLMADSSPSLGTVSLSEVSSDVTGSTATIMSGVSSSPLHGRGQQARAKAQALMSSPTLLAVNEAMKQIMCDMLVQHPVQPFDFIARQLRAAGKLHQERTITSTSYESVGQISGVLHSPMQKSARVTRGPGEQSQVSSADPELFERPGAKSLRQRRGMQPPDQLLTFFFSSYRFNVLEIVKIFLKLRLPQAVTPAAAAAGRANHQMVDESDFTGAVTENASYAGGRLESRMAQRLVDALLRDPAASRVELVEACTSLCALSVATLSDRVRCAFYCHGIDIEEDLSALLPVSQQKVLVVLKSFFCGAMRAAFQLELNGLGKHVRNRLRSAYTSDLELVSTSVEQLVKKLFRKSGKRRGGGGVLGL